MTFDPQLIPAEFIQAEQEAAEDWERAELARAREDQRRSARLILWLFASVFVSASAIGLTIVQWWPE